MGMVGSLQGSTTPSLEEAAFNSPVREGGEANERRFEVRKTGTDRCTEWFRKGIAPSALPCVFESQTHALTDVAIEFRPFGPGGVLL
jgi:hypothetical protein